MRGLDVSNPTMVRFFKENNEKESMIRIRWVKKYASKLDTAAKLTREAKNYTPADITKAVIEAGMAATTREHNFAARHKITASVPDYKLVTVRADKQITEIPPMKPTKAEAKEILQISRSEYLKKRSLLKPEDKYNFLECSSWEYGWQNERLIKMQGPAYGKVNNVIRSSVSRVGPQPDPKHYQSPDYGVKTIACL